MVSIFNRFWPWKESTANWNDMEWLTQARVPASSSVDVQFLIHLTQESHKSTHVVGCQPELVFENWVNLEETNRQHPNLYGQWTIDVVLFQCLIISWYAFLPCRPWFQDVSIYLDVSEHGVYPPIYRYFNGWNYHIIYHINFRVPKFQTIPYKVSCAWTLFFCSSVTGFPMAI